MKKIQTNNAPQAIGPYSQAIQSGNMIFISGQIALNPNGELVGETAKEQAAQVMNNLKAILEAANATFANVVKSTLFLTDLNSFADVNEVYKSFLSEPFPARATIEVKGLPKGALIEIDMTAILND